MRPLMAVAPASPNLFADENNFHSRLEWTSRQDLERAVAVIAEIARIRAPGGSGRE